MSRWLRSFLLFGLLMFAVKAIEVQLVKMKDSPDEVRKLMQTPGSRDREQTTMRWNVQPEILGGRCRSIHPHEIHQSAG